MALALGVSLYVCNQKPCRASLGRRRYVMEDYEPRHERFRFLTGSDLRQVANRRRVLAKYVGDQRLAKLLLDEAEDLDRRATETLRNAI